MTVSVEQTVATLRERAAQARAARSALAAATRAQLLGAIALHLPPRVDAWLIGSLAWGGFGEHSDIDVVVRGASPSAATRLEIALTRDVRCSTEVLRFEDLPASFRAHVEREGIALYGR